MLLYYTVRRFYVQYWISDLGPVLPSVFVCQRPIIAQDDLGSKNEGLLRYSNRSVSYCMHVHKWDSPELFIGVDSGKLSNFAFPS